MHGDRVLFLDGEALVIDKPAGLPVDPPRDGSLSLENHLDSLRFGFHRWPQAVHRLDRDTSGCLLLSRNVKAHARLQQAFEAGAVGKRYLAVLDGVPEGEGAATAWASSSNACMSSPLAWAGREWQGAAMDPDRILFVDGEALVIDKPAGLPVDPPRDGSLRLENHLEQLRLGFRRWPTAVHRLDRDTSGCLLLARNPKAAARFGRTFEAGEVEKRYLAVLDGMVEGEGVVDLPLAKTSSAAAGWRMVADSKGKAARTGWRALETRGGRTLVEFRPETGRTHQIRVHAATGLGAAVVGDPVYGVAAKQPLLLHAAALTVLRPGKEPVTAEAPLPERFASW